MLFIGMDRQLWEARGIINLIAVPLLALSAARNRDWSTNIYVSRDMVLHSTTIVGSGLYLMVMAGAGYYLQEFGGSWGRIAKVAFFTLAVVFLVTVLFSAQWRRQLRVFLGKHFYRNKYDYRREWLALTSALAEAGRHDGNHEFAIRLLAQVVDAQAGLLWLRDEQGVYRNVAGWNCRRVDETEAESGSLVQFLARQGYVINLFETTTHAAEYADLELPGWLRLVERAWLIVPLSGQDQLTGFVVIARPVLVREVNWEDRDLLKTAARQVASHLAVLLATDALAQARQFEVFNRLSSYMVHDLKNIAAGLELVARNAARHRDNPEFLEDAFDSVASLARDIRRLLEQLRNKSVVTDRRVVVDVCQLLESVLQRCALRQPVPQLGCAEPGCLVTAERQRLENVLLHLLENAQQATAADGRVDVALVQQDRMCVIEITDNGTGMDADFIEHRLFKPFDTTKGNAGMGIGMYESRELIRQLGGEIRVHSAPGQGTRMTLLIPSSTADEPEGVRTSDQQDDRGDAA
jgi:putative PEP-CTERM system histidine kinase